MSAGRGQRDAVGLIVLAVGAGILALGAGTWPDALRGLNAPIWVLLAAGGVFALAGASLLSHGRTPPWVPAVIGRSGLRFIPGPAVDDDPAGAWTAVANTLQGALDDPAVAARTFDAGPPGELRIDTAIGMLVLGDVLVHSWDLAAATGQQANLDRSVAAGMLAGMEPIDDLLRTSGHYGPRVPADPEADVVSRLIAFTGRDPGWTPPGSS